MSPRFLQGRRGRMLRSYGPLLALGIAFVIMAAAVSPLDRERVEYAGAVTVPTLPGGGTDGTAGTTDGTGGTTGGTGGTGGGTGGTGQVGALGACPGGRTKQVPGDPYSPPCYAFSGSNGGATSKGVTGDTITVAVRRLEGPSAAELFASISGQTVNDSPEAYEDTVNALAEYFSSRFQFYGRKLKIEFFKGAGSGTSELLGGGKETALADATRSAKEIGAFADISGITIPYADALAQKGVVNFGAPYPSAQWFTTRRPYSWSLFPDGTNVVRSSEASVIAGFPAGSNAEFGGPSVNGKPRRFAVVAPENAEYQESVNSYISTLGAAGIPVALNMKYKLDLATMPNQASNIIAQLKDAGVTSILCGCDPVMLALGLTPKANEQGYEPEWLTSGLAFVDQDIVSQLIDTKQWTHAFGIAYNAESEPLGPLLPVRRVQADATRRRAGVRRRGDLLPDVPAGDRAPDGGSEPHAADVRGGHVRLPRRLRPPWPVGLRADRLHADRRLPGDLVGPGPDLGPEQPGRRLGPARRWPPLQPDERPQGPPALLQGGLSAAVPRRGAGAAPGST